MSKLPEPRDAEAILETLARLRRSIPYALKPATEPAAMDAQSVKDFELQTVAEGLESLGAELSEALDQAHAKLHADALRVYYTAEELARHPANAHLIPHVEAMRRAYERDYGVPIPQK